MAHPDFPPGTRVLALCGPEPTPARPSSHWQSATVLSDADAARRAEIDGWPARDALGPWGKGDQVCTRLDEPYEGHRLYRMDTRRLIAAPATGPDGED